MRADFLRLTYGLAKFMRVRVRATFSRLCYGFAVFFDRASIARNKYRRLPNGTLRTLPNGSIRNLPA